MKKSETTTPKTLKSFLNTLDKTKIRTISLPEEFINKFDIDTTKGFMGYDLVVNKAYPEALVLDGEGKPLGRVLIDYSEEPVEPSTIL